jgi:hypothetical protein
MLIDPLERRKKEEEEDKFRYLKCSLHTVTECVAIWVQYSNGIVLWQATKRFALNVHTQEVDHKTPTNI